HCKGIIGGTTEEKYRFFRRIIESQDGEALRALEDNFKRDMCVAPLDVKWDDLHLDIDRTISTASSWSFDPDNEFKEYIYQERIAHEKM
ncbi:MAG TPA: hypothetical protein VMV86_02770, partial [Methanosarcinales archaeon]|nr:hypothetical protein [Methanosarcinales archaeon]